MSEAEHRKSRRRVPQVVRRLLLTLALLYAVPLLGLGAGQQFLVFNAAASRARTAAAGVKPPAGARTVRFRTASGDTIAAYFGHALRADGSPDTDYARRPTVLFFTGKGSSIAPERGLFQSLRRLDVNVLMPDYAGFGQSGGEESEANCFQTARAAYAWMRAQPDLNQKRLVIAGYSLGSGVAVDLAAREIRAGQPVAGLALFAAYTSMADMGHQEYPIYPSWLLRLILKYPFASDAKMPRVTCPVLLVHSRADRLIPYAMSDALTARCRGPVTRVTVTHAGHAEYFSPLETSVLPALKQFAENTAYETRPVPRHPAAHRLFAPSLVYEKPGQRPAPAGNTDDPAAPRPSNPHGGAGGGGGQD